MRYTLTLTICIACISVFQAQKYVNEFLHVGVSARALGMGNSIGATVNDISAGYWNPAAMTTIESPTQLGAMHAEWFAGIAKFDYLSFGKRLTGDYNRPGSYGAVSLLRFGIDEIPNTLNLIGPDGEIQYDQVTEFSAADYALLISYAKNIGSSGHWSLGGTAKIIHRTVGSFGKAWGFGGDLSINYRSNKWSFAVVGRDITTTFNSWSFSLSDSEKNVFEATNNEIPVSSSETTRPRIILAASRKFQLGENYTFMTEVDFDITTDGKRNVLISSDPVSVDPHAGVELGFKDIVYLRGGINNIQEVKDVSNFDETEWQFQPSFGVGLKLGKQFTIDYALTDLGDVSDVLYSNIISVFVNFN